MSVAQLDRALGYGPRCREFESSHSRFKPLKQKCFKGFFVLCKYYLRGTLFYRRLYLEYMVSEIMQKYEHLTHTFAPVFNTESKILILGSFPSAKSRENNFYYGHPQNRFWKVLGQIFEVGAPQSIEEKKLFLLEHHIAIWDVIESCTIIGSSDASIKDVVVNDFSKVLKKSEIKMIYVNGGKAYELYNKYARKQTGIEAIKLPSTSPANAAWNLEKLCKAWGIVKEMLD